MAFRRQFIVQDRESLLFLGFEDGDLVPVRLIRDAMKFETEESAALTALGVCDSGYVLFSFFVEIDQ